MTDAHDIIRDADLIHGPARYELTDLGNAKRLVAEHGHDLHYCHPWNKWLTWDGQRWRLDDTAEAMRRAKQTVEDMRMNALLIEDPDDRKRLAKWAHASQSDKSLNSMLRLASSEPGIPVLPEHLDQDPWLLNIGNGTIDLRTGDRHPHDRRHLITKIAPVHRNGGRCDRWHTFLQQVFDQDTQLIDFVQRAVGYSLTGSTAAQVFFLLYGTGENGKSTFVETVQALLGEYGMQAPPETFLERRDTIPNDVARLRGARFVAAVETAEGRRLNEVLVKRMTGGDTMTARFMRSEWFDFQPNFKVWLATNHLPDIRGTDHAIWRRVMTIPFQVKIPPSKRDDNLKTQLRAELPGILRWALDGLEAWQADGLQPPPAVEALRGSYRAEMDLLGHFLEDCCHIEESLRCKASELYTRYGYWCQTNGEQTISQQAFGRRLKERGLEQERDRTARWWLGIALNTPQDDHGDWRDG